MLYMFRTVFVHHQEQLYIAIGICRYILIRLVVVLLEEGTVIPVTTQQPDVSAYTKYDVQLIKYCS